MKFGGTGNRWDMKGGNSYVTVKSDKNWNRTERRKRNVIGLRFDVSCFVRHITLKIQPWGTKRLQGHSVGSSQFNRRGNALNMKFYDFKNESINTLQN